MYKINNLEQEKYYEFGRAYFGPFLLGLQDGCIMR